MVDVDAGGFLRGNWWKIKVLGAAFSFSPDKVLPFFKCWRWMPDMWQGQSSVMGLWYFWYQEIQDGTFIYRILGGKQHIDHYTWTCQIKLPLVSFIDTSKRSHRILHAFSFTRNLRRFWNFAVRLFCVHVVCNWGVLTTRSPSPQPHARESEKMLAVLERLRYLKVCHVTLR